MPLPLAPIAAVAVRYGVVAVTAWAIARSINKMPHDQRVEDALDDIPEGLTAAQRDQQAQGSARVKRFVRLGTNGPGVEIDLSAIGRFRVKRVRSNGS